MRRVFIAAVTVVVSWVLVSPADAGPIQLRLMNGGTSMAITDGGAGDTCAAVDCVSFQGFLGHYLINISTGIAHDANNPFLLDLNSLNVAAEPNPGLLTVAISQTGFTTEVDGFRFAAGGVNTLGSTSSFSAFGGNSNTAFDTSHLLGTLAFPASPFSGTTSGTGNSVHPYSLTIVASFPGPAPGTIAFDASLSALSATAVPEPASLALLCTGLSSAGLTIRRRLRRRSRAIA